MLLICYTKHHVCMMADLEAEVVLRLVAVRLVQVVLIGVQIRVACILQRRSNRNICINRSTASRQHSLPPCLRV